MILLKGWSRIEYNSISLPQSYFIVHSLLESTSPQPCPPIFLAELTHLPIWGKHSSRRFLVESLFLLPKAPTYSNTHLASALYCMSCTSTLRCTVLSTPFSPPPFPLSPSPLVAIHHSLITDHSPVPSPFLPVTPLARCTVSPTPPLLPDPRFLTSELLSFLTAAFEICSRFGH